MAAENGWGVRRIEMGRLGEISMRAIFNNVVVLCSTHTLGRGMVVWCVYVWGSCGPLSFLQFTFAPLSWKPFQVLTCDV
jgi:hypothetical protein